MPETVASWIAANTLTASSVLTYNQIVALTYLGFTAASVSYGEHQKRKRLGAARDDHHIDALGGQRIGAGKAQALARAAHQRMLASQSEIHAPFLLDSLVCIHA
jgi:hypothetical protein